MSEVSREEEQDQESQYHFGPPDMDDFEIVVTDEEEVEEQEPEVPEEYKNLKKADLVAKIQETQTKFQSELEELKAQKAADQGFGSLAEQLKQTVQQQQQNAPQQPQKPPELTQEEWNEKFAEDPFKAMNEFYAHKLGPEVQRLMMNNVNVSKEFIQMDEGRKGTYAKYQDEIEAEVNKAPPQEKVTNTNIYREAHDRVVARHLDDVISLKVQEALEAQTGQQQQQQQQKPAATTQYDEPGVRRQPPAGKGPVKVHLTEAEKRFGATRGISDQDLARMKHLGKLPKVN